MAVSQPAFLMHEARRFLTSLCRRIGTNLAGLRKGSSVHARFPWASHTRMLSVVQGLAIHIGGREHHETLLSGVRSRDRSKVEHVLASLTLLSHMPRAWHAAGSLEAGDEVLQRCSWLPFDFRDGGLLSRLGPGYVAGAVMAALLGLIALSQALALPTGDIEDKTESEWFMDTKRSEASAQVNSVMMTSSSS